MKRLLLCSGAMGNITMACDVTMGWKRLVGMVGAIICLYYMNDKGWS